MTHATDGTGALASFWYYGKYDFGNLPADVPLILDSGAFSAYTLGAEIKLADYAAWARDLAGRYDFAFNLDVLAEPEASLANWHALRDMGVDTTPVIHFGSHPDAELPAYLAEGVDRVALGGLASGGATPQAKAWTAHVMRWLRDNAPHVATHGLGIHLRSSMARFPWTTTDSAAWTGPWRYGRSMLWDTVRKRWVTDEHTGATLQHPAVIRQHGGDPRELRKINAENRDQMIRVAARSEVIAANDWNASTKVPARRYLVEANGLHLEAAMQEASNLKGI